MISFRILSSLIIHFTLSDISILEKLIDINLNVITDSKNLTSLENALLPQQEPTKNHDSANDSVSVSIEETNSTDFQEQSIEQRNENNGHDIDGNGLICTNGMTPLGDQCSSKTFSSETSSILIDGQSSIEITCSTSVNRKPCANQSYRGISQKELMDDQRNYTFDLITSLANDNVSQLTNGLSIESKENALHALDLVTSGSREIMENSENQTKTSASSIESMELKQKMVLNISSRDERIIKQQDKTNMGSDIKSVGSTKKNYKTKNKKIDVPVTDENEKKKLTTPEILPSNLTDPQLNSVSPTIKQLKNADQSLLKLETQNVEFTTAAENAKEIVIMQSSESEQQQIVLDKFYAAPKNKIPAIQTQQSIGVISELSSTKSEYHSSPLQTIEQPIIEPVRPKFTVRLKPTITINQNDQLYLEVHFIGRPEPDVMTILLISILLRILFFVLTGDVVF